ncbi:MAG: helix-turn-helix domain-containing protein [Gammaproteobacteria bacterium]|nr:helix-turn-helix domain-containing protein [Gammaproteobacteria bacterium]
MAFTWQGMSLAWMRPDNVSRSMAVALDTSRVTLLPFNTLLAGNEKINAQELIRKMGQTLNHDNDLIMMPSQRTAERRLAWFLVEFSDSMARRRMSPTEFSLPMSRTDIAVFLGLALETVCRELARFSDSGLIKKGHRKFSLLNLETLRHLVNGDEIHH